MRMSKLYMPTIKEDPTNADVISSKLLVRAGMVRQLVSGVYSYMPLGNRVLKNVERIVREEQDAAGFQEVLMSALQPRELWEQSGRWADFGPEMFKLEDRKGREFCLGPTHEEYFTNFIKNELNSYKQLPLIIYQIQNKYRDERRPRAGLIRGREFLMKDAYNFDADEEGMIKSYELVWDSYIKIFDRLGFDYKVVQGDSGNMGGKVSHEFIAITSGGEAQIAYCKNCDFAATDEVAECITDEYNETADIFEIEKVSTPNVKTIQELNEYFNLPKKKFVKTLLYKTNEEVIAVMIPGDIIVGANEIDYHLKNANIVDDFECEIAKDLLNARAGDTCPSCGAKIDINTGIEIGNIFQLGTKYSTALDATYLDKNGKAQHFWMGSHGIGVSRIIAALVEQNHDDRGIIWPLCVAPYKAIVTVVNSKNQEMTDLGNEIYETLKKKGVEVLIDDRKERAGVKFSEMDLIGIPLRIVVGRKANEEIVEYSTRKDMEKEEITSDEAIERVLKALEI